MHTVQLLESWFLFLRKKDMQWVAYADTLLPTLIESRARRQQKGIDWVAYEHTSPMIRSRTVKQQKDVQALDGV